MTCKIPNNQLIAIIGPNGAGKTTLIKTILKMVTHQSGSIHYNYDLNDVSYIPQQMDFDWYFPITVHDFILTGTYGKYSMLKPIPKSKRDECHKLIERLGLSGKENDQIETLSGGQKQKVLLARALARDSKILIFDEPFSAIDDQSKQDIMAVLSKIKRDGKTAIIINHDIQMVRALYDWVVMINAVHVCSGPSSEVLTDDNIKRMYKARASLIESIARETQKKHTGNI
ncbi:metal ABC transporter ATP-binding protein [Chlamydiia bacterium]|nr:metal ABC transporter ATP-binding protein [Chlamydiia bacterium]